jgi:hypothetical protein
MPSEETILKFLRAGIHNKEAFDNIDKEVIYSRLSIPQPC